MIKKILVMLVFVGCVAAPDPEPTASTSQMTCAMDDNGQWTGCDGGGGPGGGDSGGGDCGDPVFGCAGPPVCQGLGVCDPLYWLSDTLCTIQCGVAARCMHHYGCDDPDLPECHDGYCGGAYPI